MVFASSGIPSINAYNSLNFLNIMPVFAFYAMVQDIFKKHAHGSTIAAFSTFFALFTSGFGWTYVLSELLKGNAKLFSEYGFGVISMDVNPEYLIKFATDFDKLTKFKGWVNQGNEIILNEIEKVLTNEK